MLSFHWFNFGYWLYNTAVLPPEMMEQIYAEYLGWA